MKASRSSSVTKSELGEKTCSRLLQRRVGRMGSGCSRSSDKHTLWIGGGTLRVEVQHAFKRQAGPIFRASRTQKTRIVVKGQDQTMDLEQHLHVIGVHTQLPLLDGHADGAAQGAMPGQDHAGQGVT